MRTAECAWREYCRRARWPVVIARQACSFSRRRMRAWHRCCWKRWLRGCQWWQRTKRALWNVWQPGKRDWWCRREMWTRWPRRSCGATSTARKAGKWEKRRASESRVNSSWSTTMSGWLPYTARWQGSNLAHTEKAISHIEVTILDEVRKANRCHFRGRERHRTSSAARFCYIEGKQVRGPQRAAKTA